jgi:hypothetical protein
MKEVAHVAILNKGRRQKIITQLNDQCFFGIVFALQSSPKKE